MYSIAEIYRQNAKYPWIDTSQVKDPHKNYTLYATGEATLQSGRIYVALPSTIKMDNETKKRYNIM
jgi:hypothetical protein